MHYVLLWWFHEVITPNLKGFAGIVNYADDFVVCFQYKWEAEQFYERLKRRMAHFGLSLAEEKPYIIGIMVVTEYVRCADTLKI